MNTIPEQADAVGELPPLTAAYDALHEAGFKRNEDWFESANYVAGSLGEGEAIHIDTIAAIARAALSQAPRPENVYPCVRIRVVDGNVAFASLYAPGLPDGTFNVYPIGIEDCATGRPAPRPESPAVLTERQIERAWLRTTARFIICRGAAFAFAKELGAAALQSLPANGTES